MPPEQNWKGNLNTLEVWEMFGLLVTLQVSVLLFMRTHVMLRMLFDKWMEKGSVGQESESNLPKEALVVLVGGEGEVVVVEAHHLLGIITEMVVLVAAVVVDLMAEEDPGMYCLFFNTVFIFLWRIKLSFSIFMILCWFFFSLFKTPLDSTKTSTVYHNLLNSSIKPLEIIYCTIAFYLLKTANQNSSTKCPPLQTNYFSPSGDLSYASH